MAIANTDVQFYSSTMTGAPVMSNGAGGYINLIDAIISGFNTIGVTSIAVDSSGIATVACNTAHGFVFYGITGPVIEISGSSYAYLNGKWRIATIIDTTTFTVDMTGATTGTVTGTMYVKIAGYPLVKVYSGYFRAAYQFTDVNFTGHYLRIEDSATDWATITMYDTMSDVDTGTNPTTARYASKSASISPWFFVGDKLFFYQGSTLAGIIHGCAFGDIIPSLVGDMYHCYINGAGATNPNNTGFSTSNHGFLARSYTQLNDFVTATFIRYKNWNQIGDTIYPNPAGNQVIFSEVDMYEGTTIYRGKKPGIVTPHHAIANFTNNSFVNLTNGKTIGILRGSTGATIFAVDITGPWR